MIVDNSRWFLTDDLGRRRYSFPENIPNTDSSSIGGKDKNLSSYFNK